MVSATGLSVFSIPMPNGEIVNGIMKKNILGIGLGSTNLTDAAITTIASFTDYAGGIEFIEIENKIVEMILVHISVRLHLMKVYLTLMVKRWRGLGSYISITNCNHSISVSIINNR